MREKEGIAKRNRVETKFPSRDIASQNGNPFIFIKVVT